MIKLVAAVRRRPGMTHSEYTEYIEKVHGGIALANKLTVRKYIQNHVLDGAYGALGDPGYQVTLPRDSVTELYFGDLAAMGRTFADPYAREVVGPDAVNFSDQPSALSLLVEESEAEVPRPGDGRAKILHFLKAADGITPEVFRKGLRRAYEEVLADSSGPARYLRGHQWNTPLPGDGMAAYFGSTSEQPAYDAYSALWFDEADALTGFRAWQQALADHVEKHGALLQPSLSFFLVTREVAIFDDLTDGGIAA
ncbi:EthD domain-containing protein [Streptomyces sp. NRRL F-525]|uniref:EthD domain-containing protein n=1 Tax=Streptomyces sp. NRRL F-525 TaxID=1463861 RepID=UPI0005273F74|nr:EthD domain-containing protein [Streptomyces sp. NRRL F-525]